MEKITKHFRGSGTLRASNIRIVKLDGRLLFAAHDVSQALKFSNPRKEVISITMTDDHYEKQLVDWKVAEKLFVVDQRFIIELVLKAEQRMSREFLDWLISFIETEAARKTSIVNEKANSLFATTQIAKKFNMSAIQLNVVLQEQGFQYKVNAQWVLYAQHQDKGYTETVEVKNKNNGEKIMHTYWTEKGVEFVSNILESLNVQQYQQLQMFDEKI